MRIPSRRANPVSLPAYAGEVLARIQAAFSHAVESSPSVDWPTLVVDRASVVDVCRFCRDEPALLFNFLTDVTGVDWLGRSPRFEVVYHLFSLSFNRRMRLKVRLPEDDPKLPTTIGVWPTANWHEREVFDMYGIVFEGHPNLQKILTPDFMEGHPLRKDFPLGDEEIWDAEGGSIVQPPGSYRPVDPEGVKRFR
jgi:NADH-quinone oxidoreductase subunit C